MNDYARYSDGARNMNMSPAAAPPTLTAVETVDVVLDEERMYTVEWKDDATFGFTVTPVNSDRGTVLLLARRTARPAQLESAGLSRVVPGDMLIAIGDEKVYHLGAENATKYMRCVRKPVRLTMQLSPYGSSSKHLPDLAPNEYNYLWESGPLGISLTEDAVSKLPIVKRLSDKANDVVRRQVELGDQLIYANDVATCEYSIHDFMGVLKNMPKPILMRFRKPLKDADLVELPELGEDEYEFLWEYGPLGLVVGMSRAGYPFVRSFTGKGTSRQLGLVQENDEITMVNDLSTQEIGFTETMHYLMNVPKPAVLRFRRKPFASYQPEKPKERRATVPARPQAQDFASTMPPQLGANQVSRQQAMSVAAPSMEHDTQNSYASANVATPITITASPTSPDGPLKRNSSDRNSVGNGPQRSSGNNMLAMSTSDSLAGADGLGLSSLNINGPNGPPPPPITSPQMNPATYKRGNSTAALAATTGPNVPRYPSDRNVTSPAPARTNSSGSNQAYGSPYEDTATLGASTPAPRVDSAPRPASPESPPVSVPTSSPSPAQASTPVPSTGSSAASSPAPAKRSSTISNEPVFEIDESAYFQVQWTDGPFGSTVREAESTAGAVMLITKRTAKKTCVGLRRIAVGDILVRIGDKDVWELGFERATRYLRKVPKPVVLTFQAID